MTTNLKQTIKQTAIAAGILTLLPAMAACSKKEAADGANTASLGKVLARVDNAVLSLEDLQCALPSGLSREDSTAFADAFIRSWIVDNLITEVAIDHIDNTEEIERLTEDYRRRLIMWEYRQLMVSADTSLTVSADAVRQYYADHGAEMKLAKPMVKGIYIKIESDAPALNEVKKLYKSDRQEDIEKLEKVGLRGAIHYDYFRDKWIPWEQIITKIPADIPESNLRKGYSFTLDSNGFTYLLSVSDVLPSGTKMPLEAAEPQIRETLEAARLTEIDALIMQRLFQQAQADGRVEM